MLLIEQFELSRRNFSVLGGAGADNLTITAPELERSSLIVAGGEGHDDLTLDFPLLNRSDLIVRGGDADSTTGTLSEDDDTIQINRLRLERSSASVEAGNGDDRIALGEIVGSGRRLDGGHGTDTLRGPLAGASWVVSGVNSGKAVGLRLAL